MKLLSYAYPVLHNAWPCGHVYSRTLLTKSQHRNSDIPRHWIAGNDVHDIIPGVETHINRCRLKPAKTSTILNSSSNVLASLRANRQTLALGLYVNSACTSLWKQVMGQLANGVPTFLRIYKYLRDHEGELHMCSLPIWLGGSATAGYCSWILELPLIPGRYNTLTLLPLDSSLTNHPIRIHHTRSCLMNS